MLDNTLAAVSALVAHGHHQPDSLAELISKLGRVLINDHASTPVKQLALIALLEELIKMHPHDFQANNLLAVVEVLLVGPRILLAVSSSPPEELLMAHPLTNFKKWAGTEFEAYILPIIPAGATLKPESKLTPDQLGKIPGKWSSEAKAWAGFHGWQTNRATAGHLAYWEKWQPEAGTAIASGIILGDWIAVDIDSDNQKVADEIEDRFSLEIGASPVVRLRHGSSRRVLFYARDQHTPPIRKHRLAFKTEDGQQHIVEVLATGQQVIMEGPHAKGEMHYWRSGDLIDNRDWLKTNQVNGLQISNAMLALEAWVEQTPGMEKVKLSAPTGSDRAAAISITNIMSSHRAGDLDVLARCIKAIDLNDARLADYDTWVALLRAICAACGGDMAFFAETVLPWLRTNASNLDNDGDSRMEEKWKSFTDSELGADFVYQWASTFGCQDGRNAVAQELFHDTEAGSDVQDGVAGGSAGAGTPSAGGGPLPFNDTHLSIAIDFEAANADRRRYALDSRKWHLFEAGAWVDDPRVVDDLAPMMRGLSQQILATVNGPQGVARARNLENTGAIMSVKRLVESRSALTVRDRQWDTHHHLLNTPTGIIDLRTGELLSHDPSLLIRGITPVSPDMLDYGNWEKICPRWLELVRQTAYGREHIEPFLQRWFGYCLTGEIKHQHLLFIQGGASTGKSALLTALMLVLGTYATTLRQSFLLKGQQGGDKRFDMEQIIGKRMGFGDEMPKGATWDETRMCLVASAKKLAVEFKGGSTTEFTNTTKMNIASNHNPHFVSAEAGGLVRRMLLLRMINPSNEDTTGDTRDYATRLVEMEGPGILSWCIEGARLDYLDEHQHIFDELRRPLKEASREYARESNPIHDWVEAEMVIGPEHDIDLLDAHMRYKNFRKRQDDDRSSSRETRADFKTALSAAYPSVKFALRTSRKGQGKAYVVGIGFNQVEFGEGAAS